jgi:hypothetical protein
MNITENNLSPLLSQHHQFIQDQTLDRENAIQKEKRKFIATICNSGSALRVPNSVCECTPHAAPFWDPCEVDFPLTYCEEVKVILFN